MNVPVCFGSPSVRIFWKFVNHGSQSFAGNAALNLMFDVADRCRVDRLAVQGGVGDQRLLDADRVALAQLVLRRLDDARRARACRCRLDGLTRHTSWPSAVFAAHLEPELASEGEPGREVVPEQVVLHDD